jgi:hypothetical protein
VRRLASRLEAAALALPRQITEMLAAQHRLAPFRFPVEAPVIKQIKVQLAALVVQMAVADHLIRFIGLPN